MRRFILGAGIDPPGKKPARYVPRVDVYAEPSGIVTDQSGNVTAHSGIVTSQSGNHPKSVTINRIRRSRSPGFAGHVQPDCPVTLRRNTQLAGLRRKHPRLAGLFMPETKWPDYAGR